jgi:DNA-directed RNA polymerase specialized sigma24 family protein
MIMDINALLTDDLAYRCVEESSKKKTVSRDDQFCFELLRRAFGLDDHDALGHVLNIYKDVWSRFWVRDAYTFDTQSLTVDDFKSIAFTRVYERLKGSAFDGFSSLTPLLSYFHVTLARTIAHYLRSSKGQQSLMQLSNDDDANDMLENIPASENPSMDAERNILQREIDKRVAELLPDKNDRLLYGYWARQNFSHKEIVAASSPPIWKDENAVRVALQRIKRLLYKDSVLIELLEGLL